MALSIGFSRLSLALLPPPHAHLPAPNAVHLKRNAGLSNPFGGSSLILAKNLPLLVSVPTENKRHSKVAVFAKKKGYKMKTRKASAKRFRVTGTGKIVRRCAGKQHLLAKKNTKRKKRLSKMVQVDKSDYDNVIGALPYLKVNRKAK